MGDGEWYKREREGGRKGGREGGRKGEREEGRKGGREEGREGGPVGTIALLMLTMFFLLPVQQ